MTKDVEQHLNELIEFYSQTDIDDINYIKKLFIRNLKDVKNRYIKYDKPIKQRINKAIELLEKENYHCPMSLTVEKAYIIEVEKINNVISILRGEE